MGVRSQPQRGRDHRQGQDDHGVQPELVQGHHRQRPLVVAREPHNSGGHGGGQGNESFESGSKTSAKKSRKQKKKKKQLKTAKNEAPRRPIPPVFRAELRHNPGLCPSRRLFIRLRKGPQRRRLRLPS